MPDLVEKCEHFLQEKLKKLDPMDMGHLNLLAIASTHNLTGLARDLIPKVAILSVDEIRKYYGVIKSSLLLCVMDVVVHRFAPGVSALSPLTHSMQVYIVVAPAYCGNCRQIHNPYSTCKFCGQVICSNCAALVCSAGVPMCTHCGAQNSPCACAPELAVELLNLKV